MRLGIRVAVLVPILLAGCSGETTTPPSASPASITPGPTGTPPVATPAATPPSDPPVIPVPTPDPGADEEATAEGYVAPVFDAQDKVAIAADPAAFADVNPIDYRNPWR